VDPALYTRLHDEARKREQRQVEAAAAAQAAEEAAVAATGRQLRALGPSLHAAQSGGDGGIAAGGGGSVAAGERLFARAKADAARKADRVASAAAEASAAAAWVCSRCGAENRGRDATCMQPAKAGSKVEPVSNLAALHAAAVAAPVLGGGDVDTLRVCGAPRPAAFVPTISDYAAKRARPLDHDAYMALQLQKYMAERQRRADAAAAAAAAAVAECAFKPRINLRREDISAPASTSASAGGSSAARLYADALRRQRAAADAAVKPGEWHGCTFQPDIGANALRPRAEGSADDFFERLASQRTAAHARVEAQAARLGGLGAPSATAAAPATTSAAAPSAALRRPHVGPALYEAAVASQAARAANEREADARAVAEANRRHISAGSTRLLLAMRRRALAGIFSLLARSVHMTEAQRAAEAADAAAFDSALAAGGDGGGGGGGTDVGVSVDELAHLIAAVDAHAGVLPTDGELADGAHVEVVFADAAIAAAAATTLPVARAWTGVLDKVLARYVDVALAQLALRPRVADGGGEVTASLDDFCGALGAVLENAGGGPHIYLLAKRHRERERSASAGVAGGRGVGGVAGSEDGADTEAAPLDDGDSLFQPAINAHSRHLVERARAEARAGVASVDGSVSPPAGGASAAAAAAALPAYERLHNLAAAPTNRRTTVALAVARAELEAHPFHPAPAAAAGGEAAAPTGLVAQVAALRARNADLVARAKAVMASDAVTTAASNSAAAAAAVEAAAEYASASAAAAAAAAAAVVERRASLPPPPPSPPHSPRLVAEVEAVSRQSSPGASPGASTVATAASGGGSGLPPAVVTPPPPPAYGHPPVGAGGGGGWGWRPRPPHSRPWPRRGGRLSSPVACPAGGGGGWGRALSASCL